MVMGKDMPYVQDCEAAPVAVFAFRRADLLKKTLASLARCHGVNDRKVIIYCDGPREGVAGEDTAAEAVRKVARNWISERNGRVVVSSKNQGLRNAITSGVSELTESHGRVIVLEDDIVVARYFLNFMDDALDRFENARNIWQVSAYLTPTSRVNYPCGFIGVPGCWGWGTWKRAWQRYVDDAGFLLSRIDKAFHHRFNVDGSYDYIGDLKANAAGEMDTWHVRWYASMFLDNALALFPGRSLTRNIGFDSRGTNCGAGVMTRTFALQRLAGAQPDLRMIREPFTESGALREEMRRFFEWQAGVWSRTSLCTRLLKRFNNLFAR